MSPNDGVAVVGVGIHPFGRHPGVSGLEMAAVAARAALTDAGIGWAEVDFAAGGSDAAGSLIADSTVTAGGTFATPGTNPYPSRGSQQLKATLTATGDTLNHATAGAVTFNVFFSIVP